VPKPARLIIAVSLALCLLLALPVALVLLLASERGTAYVAGLAGERLGDELRWRRLKGSALGALTVEGLEITQPQFAARIDELVLDWQPSALLRGELRLQALRASGIEVVLRETDSPQQAGPFDPTALLPPLDLVVNQLSLQDLRLSLPGRPVQVIDAVELQADLAGDRLTLTDLTIRLPTGELSVSGSTAMRERMPLELSLALDWVLPEPAPGAGGERIGAVLDLQGQLHWSAEVAADFSYHARLRGLQGLQARLPDALTLQGTLAGEQGADHIQLRELALRLPEHALSLEAAGEARGLGGEPALEGKLHWSGLAWPLGSPTPDVYSREGELDLAGTLSDYRLSLDMLLEGVSLPPGRWRGEAGGNADGLVLQRLGGEVLEGLVALTGRVDWQPALRWELDVSGRDLNPAAVVPDYPGLLTGELRTTGQIDADAGLSSRLELQRLDGVLLDYPLALQASAALAGETLQLDALALRSGSNTLEAEGSLSAAELALQWRLLAPDPAALLPGAGGLLQGEGGVAGTVESPRFTGVFSGEALRLDGLSLSRLRASLSAGLATDAPLDIDIDLGALSDGEQALLQALSLRARGTTAAHRIDLELDAEPARLSAQLQGGLSVAASRWEGVLVALEAAGAAIGAWSLADATALVLAADGAGLEQACLQRAGDAARICASGAWRSGGDSELSVSVDALPLDSLAPAVSGDIHAELVAGLGPDGALTAAGRMRLDPGLVTLVEGRNARQLAHRGGDLQLKVNDKGLAATLRFRAPEHGELDAELNLPSLRGLPLTEPQPLAGGLVATLPDLAGLAALVEAVDSLSGSLRADLAFGGTLAAPTVAGEMVLADGAARLPAAGLDLSGIALRAVSDPAAPGSLAIAGELHSGPGRAQLSGVLDLSGRATALHLTGDRLQLFNTADARVLVSPDLWLGWREDALKLQGLVAVPFADITPRLRLVEASGTENLGAVGPAGTLITPSSDVVIIGGEGTGESIAEPVAAPFAIDAQVALVLGDDIHVKAAGLNSSLSGAVTFSIAPGQPDRIPNARGMISLEDGTFRSFGQDLDIETGQLVFSDVPATNPEVNLRAVRWIDNDPEVTAAGIQLVGPLTAPRMELFSRPQLDESEIQSYLLTGSSAGRRDNVLGIGTYLTRRIYVGYGYNLLEETSEFNLLFSVTPRYGLGVSVGEADSNINLTFIHER
jgi:autotransporter translocation and assembly factor TamB